MHSSLHKELNSIRCIQWIVTDVLCLRTYVQSDEFCFRCFHEKGNLINYFHFVNRVGSKGRWGERICFEHHWWLMKPNSNGLILLVTSKSLTICFITVIKDEDTGHYRTIFLPIHNCSQSDYVLFLLQLCIGNHVHYYSMICSFFLQTTLKFVGSLHETDCFCIDV